MDNTQSTDAPALDEGGYSATHQNPLENPRWVMGILLTLGVVLFFFAGPLGKILATQYNGNFQYWTDGDVREMASNVRFFAAMLFSAGLIERVAIQIAMLKT